MKIFWESRTGGSSGILSDINASGAKPMEGFNDVLVSKTEVFLRISEYSITGFSFTAEDLRKMLSAMEKK